MNSIIQDRFKRPLKYLRISVTDRCNFRCLYCMPKNDFNNLKCSDILRYEDILFISESFAELGVRRIRITGGEPLVRKGVCSFLAKLTKTPGINEVMMTTNGVLLPKYAGELKEAGVKRLNISLDSLKEERFNYIAGVNRFQDAMDGIKAAVKEGFSPIKVNCVAIKGFNDDELADFCHFAADNNIIVRFIEFMPIGNSPKWDKESIITGNEIIKILEKFEPVQLERDENAGPAKNYKLNNGGIIGIITPLSRHFCADCDKLRLTADGKIRPCLLSDNEIDLKKAVKEKDKDKLKNIITEALTSKHQEHNILLGDQYGSFKRTMSKIGG